MRQYTAGLDLTNTKRQYIWYRAVDETLLPEVIDSTLSWFLVPREELRQPGQEAFLYRLALEEILIHPDYLKSQLYGLCLWALRQALVVRGSNAMLC
jgi:hypothetical protein